MNPDTPPRPKFRLTLTAALLAMLGPFTIDTYLPAFPDIEASFDVSRAILSQSLGIYLFAFAISTLVWGPLSDRYGRRMIVLVSLSLYILSTIGCALANNIEIFLIMRFFEGLAASGGFVASRAMIRDAHDSESAHRAMSHVMLMFALAPAIAPILGGWLDQFFGWRSIFWFLCLFALALIAIVLFVEETLPRRHRRSAHPRAVFSGYLLTLKRPVFLYFVLTMSCGFGGLFLYIAGAPTVIYDFLKLGSEDFSWLFIPLVGGMMSGAAISSQLAHRWPLEKTIRLGFLIMLFASLLNLLQWLLFEPVTLTIVGPMVLFTLGIAIAMPALTILALDCFPERRGMASAMQGFIQANVNSMAASLVLPILDARLGYFVLAQGLFFALTIGFWVLAWRKKSRLQEQYASDHNS